nr:hypothetical protein Hi04_10k_c2294_00017 [uncultured bacterium]
MTSEERFDRIETTIEKQNAGIRDLIIVSRTVLSSIQEMGEVHRQDHDRLMDKINRLATEHDRLEADIDKLREAQAETAEKLNILIDTVDRIIRENRKKE